MKTVSTLLLEPSDFTQPDGNLRKAAFEAFASAAIVINGNKVMKNQYADPIPTSNTRQTTQRAARTATPPQDPTPTEDTRPLAGGSIHTRHILEVEPEIDPPEVG